MVIGLNYLFLFLYWFIAAAGDAQAAVDCCLCDILRITFHILFIFIKISGPGL